MWTSLITRYVCQISNLVKTLSLNAEVACHLKNGILTCGCFIRKEAPDPTCHKEVAGFDDMFRDTLRRLIIQQYAQSGFNNCRIQPLKIMKG